LGKQAASIIIGNIVVNAFFNVAWVHQEPEIAAKRGREARAIVTGSQTVLVLMVPYGDDK